METVLYCADVAYLSDERLFARLYGAMGPARRAKIDALRRAEDKRLSLGAGVLLRTALAARGLREDGIRLGAYGKPELDGIFFSLSHSGTKALCAVGECRLGCDIERIDRGNTALAERVCCAQEREYVARGGAEAFCRLWTVKESVEKADGRGLSMPMEEIRVVLSDTGARLADGSYVIREFGNAAGYRAACALERDVRTVWTDVDLREDRIWQMCCW